MSEPIALYSNLYRQTRPTLDRLNLKQSNSSMQHQQKFKHPIEQFDEFHNGVRGLRMMKKRLRNLTIDQHQKFKENIKVLIKFFSQKNRSNVKLTIMAFQQFSNVINVYEANPWPMTFTDEMIKKLRFCFEEIMEDVQKFQDSSGNIVLPKNIQIDYENKINPLLYLIIVLIAQAQKQRTQPHFYKTHLNNLLNRQLRKMLVQLPLFNEEKNLKFYAVIIGHVGENYSNDRQNRQLETRVFKVFEKLNHQKNLYYLINFLRDRIHDFNFDQFGVNSSIMIRKMKGLIKEMFQSYQIATVLDFYNKLMLDNSKLMSEFYDQKILDFTLNVHSGLSIKFPTSSYKIIYYCAARKYTSYMIKLPEFTLMQSSSQYLNLRLSQFTQYIIISSTHLQQNSIFVQHLFYTIKQQCLYELLSYGLLERIKEFFNDNNYSIIISGLNILKEIIRKIDNNNVGMRKILYNQMINAVEQLCTVANQFAVRELAKEVKGSLDNFVSLYKIEQSCKGLE